MLTAYRPGLDDVKFVTTFTLCGVCLLHSNVRSGLSSDAVVSACSQGWVDNFNGPSGLLAAVSF